MIYDVNTRELTTNRGHLLKVLNCPLHKNWDELTPMESVTPQRHCESCQKDVLDLTGWSDDEAELFLGQDPEHCVYAPPDAPNVRTKGHSHFHRDDPCPFRRIATARGEDAINQGVKDGFWPLVKKVERSEKIHSWMAVYQNLKTGEVQTVGDFRLHPVSPWKQIVEPFTFYPDHFEHHIAAYLLPDDLKVGERVFLTDLIEDVVGVWGNQSHTIRLDAGYAVWDGQDFKIEWDENKNASHRIG